MTFLLTGTTLAFLAPIILVWVHPRAANVKIWLAAAVVLWLLSLWRQKKSLSETLRQDVSARRLIIMTGAALALFIARGILDYTSFKTSGLDFSVFDLALYNSVHGRFMWTPMCDCNHFGIHPTYILLPIIGLYALAASPWLLIILHPVVAWLAVWPLWQLARRHLPGDGLAALVLIAYLANPWVGSIVGYGFHMEVFYLPAGLWFLWGWTKNRPTVWVPSLIVFLAVKEDAALYMTAFGLYSLWKEPAHRRAAATVLAASVALFCLNTFYVQPLFQMPGASPTYLTFWAHYGSSLGEIVRTMALSPGKVLADVLSSQWYLLFGSALLLPLLAPHAVATMLPAMLILGTSSVSPMRNYGLYYAAPLIPFFFWGLVTAYGQLIKRLTMQRATVLVAAAALILPFTRNGSITLQPPKSDVQADLDQIIDKHQAFTGPICAQLSLVPHLPYGWDVRKLTPECAATAGAKSLGHPDLTPYPYDRATIESLFAGSTRFPSGLLLKD